MVIGDRGIVNEIVDLDIKKTIVHLIEKFKVKTGFKTDTKNMKMYRNDGQDLSFSTRRVTGKMLDP